MALFQCPECGHQVSDKAVACPNCGCPVSCSPEEHYTFEYNGITKDISAVVNYLRAGQKRHAVGDIFEHFNATPTEAAEIFNGIKSKYNIVIPEPVKPVPKCPTCGSEKIHKLSAGARGVSLGLFGLASKTARSQFVCDNCGYKW